MRGFWRGYFAGRAAPLGAASAAVVTASFFNFAPAFVARAIPGVWELITPDEALRVRLAGATEALREPVRPGGKPTAAAAADLLWRAIGELDFSGRVLAAADAALPVPGDGSGPALAGGHRGCASTGATGISRPSRRRTSTAVRPWSCGAAWTCGGRTCSRCGAGPTRQWDDALARLAERGWVGADGELTSAGLEAHAAVENATDWAAARPWARLGAQATAELANVLTPLAQACASRSPTPAPSACPLPALPADLAAAG